ncbi:MAG: glutathione S-transferase family protein [Cohaesibacter sp.]|jgi:glutathione S-transferase|nr:glutathione S-transferase family protein [Cohaesibacter sp.]
MVQLTLYIGNKNYSSWSLRPWLAMTAAAIPFTEILSRFDESTGHAHFIKFSPTKKVPALVIEEEGKEPVTIPESLAILETMADLYPQKGLWPESPAERAIARSLASEMHGGFFGLRGECPMNMRRKPGAIEVSDAVRKDVKRIESIWQEQLQRSGGPFLFGEFGIVDAMFAPVVNRLEIYELSDHPAVKAYTKAMKALPAWQDWVEEALKEPWVVEEDEA